MCRDVKILFDVTTLLFKLHLSYLNIMSDSKKLKWVVPAILPNIPKRPESTSGD